ncbi:S41 family peptidase [Paenibacillus auburnensis]|nr:S41 family peptidase [Paenibacillus auburnensis]
MNKNIFKTRKTGFAIITTPLICLLSALLLSSCSPKSSLTLDWKPDLQLVKQEMRQKEVSLATNSGRAAAFSSKIDEMIGRLPDYDNDDQVKIDLSQAIASLGQVHTNLGLAEEKVLPFRLYMWQGRLYVTDTITGYSEVLYTELTEINSQPVRSIIAQLTDVISRDNEQGLLLNIPRYIIRPSILHGLGVIEDKNEISLTFKQEDGTDIQKSVQPVSQNDSTLNLISPYKDTLLSSINSKRNYSFTNLSAEQTLYVAYNSCEEDPEYTIKRFVQDIKTSQKASPVQKVIVDLRANSGGNSSVIHPLMTSLLQDPVLKNHVLVLIGRGTASSAMLNAYEFRENLQAKLLGEPTNGDPNKPGEVQFLQLPETGLTVTYSTNEFHFSATTDDALMPDIPVDYTISDYREGIDPVLNAALAYRFQD